MLGRTASLVLCSLKPGVFHCRCLCLSLLLNSCAAATPHAYVTQEYHEGRLVRQQVLSPQQVSSISSALSAAASLVDASNTTSGSGKAASSSRQQVTSLGEVMFKDHSAYDLMVQLQLGIR